MIDMKKKATDILEDYSDSYSQVDLETLTKFLEQIKSEAIKEFWDRLSENADTTQLDAFHSAYLIKDEDAENLIKEMTEQRGERK